MYKLPKYFSKGYRTPPALWRRFKWGRQRVNNRVSDYDLYSLHTTVLEIMEYGLEHMGLNLNGWPDQLFDTPEEWKNELLHQSSLARFLLTWEDRMYSSPRWPESKFHFEPVSDGYSILVDDNTDEERATEDIIRETYRVLVKAAERDFYRFIRTSYYHLWD